jgi:hypothetical protein
VSERASTARGRRGRGREKLGRTRGAFGQEWRVIASRRVELTGSACREMNVAGSGATKPARHAHLSGAEVVNSTFLRLCWCRHRDIASRSTARVNPRTRCARRQQRTPARTSQCQEAFWISWAAWNSNPLLHASDSSVAKITKASM